MSGHRTLVLATGATPDLMITTLADEVRTVLA